MYGCVHVPLSVFGIVLYMFSHVSCVCMSFWCVSLSVFGCVILPDFLMCWCVVSCMVFGVVAVVLQWLLVWAVDV